jgi:hypothetical protein
MTFFQLQTITGPYAVWFDSYPLLDWLLRRVIPYTPFRLRAHDRCAYSSMSPDPTFTFVVGLCSPKFNFVYVFFFYFHYILHIVNFVIRY